MGWALVISLLIGAICALRVPVLVFALLVIAVLVIYAVVSYSSGSTLWHAVLWGGAFAVMLEAGYVLTHVLLHAFYTRRVDNDEKRTPQGANPKYPAD
ncbi:hypothetical protein [Rhizobium sp. AN80A]|uniref:hypothetical protein n=1 Tax=Rhizobium sp. AN80A TaxID=3040673 RepID=UPI000DD58FBD|nr:hypothetical protein [Rhizobium sp. AN80A]